MFQMVGNPRGQWQAVFFTRNDDGTLSVMSIVASDSLHFLAKAVREIRQPGEIIRYRRA